MKCSCSVSAPTKEEMLEFTHTKRPVKPFSHSVLVHLYALSVLLLIYLYLNFTELERVADIEYGSIDHSLGCILSGYWALRQMPSLWSHLHLEIENNYCLSDRGKLCRPRIFYFGFFILQNWHLKYIKPDGLSAVKPLLVNRHIWGGLCLCVLMHA